MAHTILLADDSVTIQRVIELTFADEDVQVVAVSDGDQAIARLNQAPPDIVLADIGMPGKDGYEVARYIKQSPRLSHIPVVLLTGAFEPVDQARAAEVRCDGVLAKPFEPQLVIGRVKELLSSGAPRVATADADAGAEAGDASGEALPDGHSELDDYFDRLDVAFAKLSGQQRMVEGFDLLPVGQWFRYFVGLLETVGGIAVLVPAVSGLGALLLLVVDVGAFFAQVFFLHEDWIHTIVIGAILIALIYVQRDAIRERLGM